MAKILVDTNILIEFLRLKDKSQSRFVQTFQSGKHIPSVSNITISELWAGKSTASKTNRQFIEKLLNNVEIFYANLEISKKTGEIIRESNYSIAFQDAQIVATTIFYSLPLLTLNKKDFQNIKGVRLYA